MASLAICHMGVLLWITILLNPDKLKATKILLDLHPLCCSMTAEAVKVIVRCRPMNSRESKMSCKDIVSIDGQIGQCLIRNPNDKKSVPKTFTFDGAYDQNSTTEQIYADIGYPLVEVGCMLMCACVRACVRACICVCAYACVCVRVSCLNTFTVRQFKNV